MLAQYSDLLDCLSEAVEGMGGHEAVVMTRPPSSTRRGGTRRFEPASMVVKSPEGHTFRVTVEEF